MVSWSFLSTYEKIHTATAVIGAQIALTIVRVFSLVPILLQLELCSSNRLILQHRACARSQGIASWPKWLATMREVSI